MDSPCPPPCTNLKVSHTGLEALPLPSKKKVSVHGTCVPVFLRPLSYWDGVVKPEKMGKKIKFGKKIG